MFINESPLMKKIQKTNYYVEPINAIIEDGYIIPGLNGYEIDELKSYYKMKEKNVFDSNLLVYKEIKPIISIDNNKDKIVKHGNRNINRITIFINDNKSVIKYCDDNNIKYNLASNNYNVEYSLILNNESINNLKIINGDIVFITDFLNLDFFKYFLIKTNFYNLQIVSLEQLLSESRGS